MAAPRTTTSLIKSALAGAAEAGLTVRAADVRSGGVIRLYFVDPETSGVSDGGNTCDDAFGGKSD